MKRMMMVLILLLGLAACSPSEAAVQQAIEETAAAQPSDMVAPESELTPQGEAISETFRSYVDDFLRASSTLNAATGQGINYPDYRNAIAEVSGAYDLVLSTWPGDFAPAAKDEFSDALTGWDLAGYLWNLKLQDGAAPSKEFTGALAGMEASRFSEFEAFAGQQLQGIEITRPRRQIYNVSDENISILLSLASDHFEAGRDILLAMITDRE